MTPVIELENVSRSFGKSTALTGVSTVIEEGSIVGLLGRNGAGKTTLMSLLAGQDRPSAGKVAVCGEDPFERPGQAPHVVFVRDNQRYPERHTLEHVLSIAPVFAPGWSAELAEEIVQRLRIPRTTPLKKFSRGQLSAVAVLAGLASRAAVTLLDEPYLGLDVIARDVFHDLLIRDHIEYPRTIILSTHLIEESEALFDRVLILDAGQINLDIPIESVCEQATVLSGEAASLEGILGAVRVLHSRKLGGFLSVTIAGEVGDEFLIQASAQNVTVTPATLLDLVAAYGADAPEAALTQKGTRQ